MHPVDIASKVLRQLDFLATDTVAGPQIPNQLDVAVNPSDVEPETVDDDLLTELQRAVTETAFETGWRIIGPVTITLRADRSLPKGVLSCHGEAVRGELPVWGHLIADDGSAVLNFSVNRSLIGRDLDCDVRLGNAEISRHHAVVYHEGGHPRVFDLGSSNGTFVNRKRVTKSPSTLTPGDSVVLGDLPFTYRSVD